MSKLQKTTVVLVGAIVFSAIGIQATDTLRGVNTSLSGLLSESSGPCGKHEVQLLLGSHSFCVDQFEAAADLSCPHESPNSQIDTQDNLNSRDCFPVTEPDRGPWRFVSLTQAQQLCARAGKRIPTNEEWYHLASGMIDENECITDANNVAQTAENRSCVTPAGVYDTVGNVWEWVAAEITDATYNDRQLPDSGYVSLVDSHGVVLDTSSAPVLEFGNDYAWTKNTGVYGMIRGGFYGSDGDAGIFAQNLSVPLDFKVAGVGFRCVRDI